MRVTLPVSAFILTYACVALSMGSTHAAEQSKRRIDNRATQEARLMIKHRQDIDEQTKKLGVHAQDGRPTFGAISSICDSRCKMDANRCRMQIWRADLMSQIGDIINERPPYDGPFEIPDLDQDGGHGGERPAPSTKRCDEAEAACLKKCACLKGLQ